MTDYESSLGREWSATDQPPGFYQYRSGRGCPWQPVQIAWDGYHWHCLLREVPVPGSGQRDPVLIPFIRDRGPFHPIRADIFFALVEDYRRARPGSPLSTPDQPVNLRRSAPL